MKPGPLPRHDISWSINSAQPRLRAFRKSWNARWRSRRARTASVSSSTRTSSPLGVDDPHSDRKRETYCVNVSWCAKTFLILASTTVSEPATLYSTRNSRLGSICDQLGPSSPLLELIKPISAPPLCESQFGQLRFAVSYDPHLFTQT